MCQSSGSFPLPRTSSDSAGIPSCIPSDKLSQKVFMYVRKHLQPTILAHSLRVFQYAQILSERESNSTPDSEPSWHAGSRLSLLFAACMFHDFGACSLHDDGSYRFEVEGADAAVRFLKAHDIHDETDLHAVWVAIACHTSPHIGERISTLGRIMRQSPLLDFHRSSSVSVVRDALLVDSGKLFVLESDVEHIEDLFPRDDIEKVLSDSVVAQARRHGRRGKAPGGSWPGDLFAAADADPGWTGINRAF